MNNPKIGSIKVNILTGLLGSGKTTMISNIIKLPELKSRVVIIQNEFTQGKINCIIMALSTY